VSRAARDGVALVVGGSHGIGRALVLALADRGHQVLAVARARPALDETVEAVERAGGSATSIAADVTEDAGRAAVIAAVEVAGGRLAVLVHSAGAIVRNRLESATVEEFDLQWQANVRAPFALTRELLAPLRAATGQVVFVNSTAALVARATASQYAATQAALRALATAFRDEVNGEGIRVTTVFAGRTASPRQERVQAFEGREYHPERLLQPEDVAAIVVAALELPRTAEVTELTVRNMRDV
jgi:short-subunit dehydrogenase